MMLARLLIIVSQGKAKVPGQEFPGKSPRARVPGEQDYNYCMLIPYQ